MEIQTKNLTIRNMNSDEFCEFLEVFKLKNKNTSIIKPSVVKYNNGDVYKGEVNLSSTNEYLRNGYGEIIYANGSVFATRWNNDIANGGGVNIQSDGTDIRGYWINGVLNNKKNTIIKFTNGDIYKGNVCNNRLCGNGIYKYSDGEIYDGEYFNGIKTGYGITYWPNSNMYEGYWADDTFNGYGILHIYDKIYTGLWCNGVQDESGEILSANKN